MRQLTIQLTALLMILLTLAACAPGATAVLTPGEDGALTVVAASPEPLYDASVSLSNARTADERCMAIDEDIGCLVGDLEPDVPVTVTAVSTSPGDNYCVLYGYAREGDLTSYRPYPCEVR